MATQKENKAPRITAWCIEIKWDDNSTEKLTDVPNYVSRNINSWLDGVEEERLEDEYISYNDAPYGQD